MLVRGKKALVERKITPFLFRAENFQNEIIRALYTAPVINFSII